MAAHRAAGPGRLDAAFAALVRRHESLRTRFTVVDGVVRQDILDGWAGVDWRVATDATEVAVAARAAAGSRSTWRPARCSGSPGGGSRPPTTWCC
ncbi:hypothetical protein V2I01_32845 [Micromonospora sp. BRA006-A]|nr:hypothetical protein [Micromonospora sp. BRA006-A]